MADNNTDESRTPSEDEVQAHVTPVPRTWTTEDVLEAPDAPSEDSDVDQTASEEENTADGGVATASKPEVTTESEPPAAPEVAESLAGSDTPSTEDDDAGTTVTPAASDAEGVVAEQEASESAVPVLPTAVGLGLIPETFVSEVSTALHFYAPDFESLPPLPPLTVNNDEGSNGRRRRRRGGSEQNNDDAGSDQRRGQKRPVEFITEPQRIKGSTRLEAKKQRRRDGREAGRRRTVVTEAEFLARREAVDRQMVVRSKDSRVQIAVLEDNVLVEHYVARNQDASLIGNVYIGRVQNVLPSMEAAFVDIGRGRNAVLYSGEVDWDGVQTGNQPRRIENALKTGDKVLVQVTKDPVGHKGARLTSQISLPGRYLVYVPNGSMNGISRKLPDTERTRLKRILKEVLPESSGVIVRTAAEGATEEQLTLDVQRLTSQWEHISSQVASGNAPQLLHSEPDVLVKIVRDVFNEDFTKMLIQGTNAQSTIEGYLRGVAPDLLERVERYEGDADPFDTFRVTEQIEKALDRKVWLPSGGSLVIDRTEAMTVVDVNTGKFVGSGGNLEETVTKNNLEAAEEIVRQLRLRDIGGIIVIDFIDMVLESNRDLVLRRLVECLSRDRTKHQVAEVTSLGLVQMTRKKLGLGLLETFSEPCEVCAGRGVVVHHDPVSKHRSHHGGNGNNQNSGSSRRSRGSQNNAQQAQSQPAAASQTHTITEGTKSALAMIAASTIPAGATEEAAAGGSNEAVADAPQAPEIAPPKPEKSKRPRKKRQSNAPKSETDQLLESVLDALPAPKAPGQGRGRRRVTTQALTGTPVSAHPETAAPTSED